MKTFITLFAREKGKAWNKSPTAIQHELGIGVRPRQVESNIWNLFEPSYHAKHPEMTKAERAAACRDEYHKLWDNADEMEKQRIRAELEAEKEASSKANGAQQIRDGELIKAMESYQRTQEKEVSCRRPKPMQ
jgi:hypothetical protein